MPVDATELVRLKVCRHYHAREDTKMADPAPTWHCPSCGASGSDAERWTRTPTSDKEIREKIHFKAPSDPDDDFPSPDDPEWCNCGLKWPCPILRVYEDLEKGLTARGVVYAHDPAQPGKFIWRCACGTLNDYYSSGTPFCKGCRIQNPVADAAYSIQEVSEWPTNIRR